MCAEIRQGRADAPDDPGDFEMGDIQMIDAWVIKKHGSFYRANYSGYTDFIEAAGVYTQAQAEREAAVEPKNMQAIPLVSYRADLIRSFERVKAKLDLLGVSTE